MLDVSRPVVIRYLDDSRRSWVRTTIQSGWWFPVHDGIKVQGGGPMFWVSFANILEQPE